MTDSTSIIVQGARQHNLKNIDVEVPKNKLVVFTGLSGSGKSSLAFDTLYAEGQRRYVESLSSYARQFLGIMTKPDVDHIEGLSPAISIDQKTTSHNPRSTVGTITEIYDYLRLLFARVGHPHCPNCGREIASQSVDQIIDQIHQDMEQHAVGSVPVRCMILSPVVRDRKGEFSTLFDSLRKKGFQRIRVDGQFFDLSEDITLIKTNQHTISVVIDRLVISQVQLKDPAEIKRLRSRLSQSVEQALKLSDGFVIYSRIDEESMNFPDKPTDFTDRLFSEKYACSHCGISIPELEPRLFSFNSPHGACPKCNGIGSLLKINRDTILAPELSLSEGALIPFSRILSKDTWWSRLVQTVVTDLGYDFRKTALKDFKETDLNTLLYGSEKVYTVYGINRQGESTSIQESFEGFIPNMETRYQESDSDFIRKEIEQYMQRQTCDDCLGTRLKDESLSVTIQNKTIAEITQLPIDQALTWVEELHQSDTLSEKEKLIGESILKEITTRLSFLSAVGLNYLTLHREAATLAGGEAQRIRLASQIGTGLTGVLYILDEPTIGLHQRDNFRLIKTLENLRDKGNSVIVVEHDRDIMLAADHILDFGPGAGETGGEIVSQGTPTELMADTNSLTGKYLKRTKDISRPHDSDRKIVSDDQIQPRTSHNRAIKISGAKHHNLKGIDVDFPLQKLTCITGISGSGKSTLMHDILYYHLASQLGKNMNREIGGDIHQLSIPDEVKRLTFIDQSPIGKTPRSNPATYTKVFDYIRKIFANTKDAKLRGYSIGRFSFNVKGGRCEACQGDGQLKIEMQFLPDVYVTCDVCQGKRYNQETLEVRYKDKTIADVLNMDVNEAVKFFSTHSTLKKKLETLQEVGLGYIDLGQPAPTLSGGEAQRVKLAKELSSRTTDHVVYLLDEPTTGLHFEDIQKLLNVLHQLVAQNNTVIVIEHNLDVIKNADWIVDLGPEGGEYGGEIIATGTPHQVAQNEKSFTGSYLKAELA